MQYMIGKKLANEKAVRGAGRLTQDMIKRVQNYYSHQTKKRNSPHVYV